MRLRLIIPAALAAAATYAAIVREEGTADQAVTSRADTHPSNAMPPAPDPATDGPARGVAPVAEPTAELSTPPTATATATAARDDTDDEPGVVGAPLEVEWTEMEGIPALAEAPAPEPVEEPVPDGPVLDEGRFAIGGWAAAPGHSVVSAVTYHHRLPVVVPAERVLLTVDGAENVPERGLVVLADPGFAPDREGFTLLLAAADPGPFSATGSYRVIG